MSAGTVVLDVRELIGVEDGFGVASALLAERLVGRVVGVGLLTGDLVQDVDNLLPLLEGNIDALSELSLGVEVAGPDDLAVDSEGVYGVKEGLNEVVGVVAVLAAGAGNPADGHTHIFLILGGKEIVPPPEGVEGVDEVYEFDIFAEGFDRAADRLSGDCFSQTSDVNDSSRTDSGCDEGSLRPLSDVLCDNVCPVHTNRLPLSR